MLRTMAVFFTLAIMFNCGALYADDAYTPIPEQRVAVMNLKVTGDSSDQIKDWLPTLIEDNLMQKGWTLVVRGERMQHIQDERNLAGVDPDTRAEGNTLLGATAFLELTARIQITGIQGALGFGRVTLGDYVRVSVDLNGQIVDVKTGVLKSSVKVGGSAGGLKTVAIVALNRDWDIRGGGINLAGIRQSLAGKAADKAAIKLVDKLDSIYGSSPVRTLSKSKTRISGTAISAQDSVDTIMINFTDSSTVAIGSRYGVYRDDKMIAELEIVKIVDSRTVEAKVLSQTSTIKSTDRARKMPLTISAE